MKHAETKGNRDASQHNDYGGRYKYRDGKHPPRKCSAYGRKCAKCNHLNHFAMVCKSEIVNSVGESEVYAINELILFKMSRL